MKNLYINGELVLSAEKIYVDNTSITCSNGDNLKGVNFDSITYEIKNESGNVVEADKTELQLLQQAVDDLILGGAL